ncbi:MAG: EAL domain-containing protein [Sulfuricella sp.]|nr:EAL domain-containing protein [Sulfuricella sp.]
MPPTLSPARRKTINQRTGWVILLWTLVVGSSLAWNIHQENAKVMGLAMAEAKANLDRDLAFRLWATSRGGLYAVVGGKVQPTPFLAHIANRDLTATSGEKLTLMNPATMLRQMMEEFSELYGVKARITGLKVLNPGNRPDDWEKQALLTFEQGRKEAVTVMQIDGEPHLRVMRPMIMEQGCLQCHAWTHIPVGGIRGATDVSVPLKQYFRIKQEAVENLGLTHGGIWLLGLIAAGFVSVRARRQSAEREQAEENLRKLSRAVEYSPNAVIITDLRGSIEYVNPKFTEINGYEAEEVVGRNPRLLASGETPPELYREMWTALASGVEWRGEFRNRRKDGELYWCLESISPVKNEYGAVTHFVGMMEDISERKLAESTIRRLAFYDPLTDLPNRRLMRERLERAIIWSRREESLTALLYIDLDRFKTVNDTLGHGIGDALLKAVSARLAHCVREEDTIARLGGDEFAVVLGNVHGSEEAATVAEKIIEIMEAPFPLGGHEVFASASIGISLYPTDSTNLDTLLKNADIALYQAKDLGRNTFQFYSESVNTLAMERLELEIGLRKAVERGELYLEYQPQLDLANGEIVGLEALARWRHPTLGSIPPAKFIPLAEETRLIVPIGEWLLRAACNQLRAWHDAGFGHLSVAVNLSAVQFRQKGLLETVARALDEAGIPPGKLELEITESILMSNTGETIATLNGLSGLGVRLSIDDFGTGYSSLGYLKRFPVSTLKIDRSFVRDITVDPDDRAIAEAVIALARSLKLWVIAEGVETQAQLEILRQLDCDGIQGYLISRPMAADKVAEFMEVRGEG